MPTPKGNLDPRETQRYVLWILKNWGVVDNDAKDCVGSRFKSDSQESDFRKWMMKEMENQDAFWVGMSKKPIGYRTKESMNAVTSSWMNRIGPASAYVE